MEEQFNKGAMEGWRFATDAARIKDEDRKQTSGGAFVAVDINLEAVVGSEEGAVGPIPSNEGGNCPSMGKCVRRYACLLGVLLALGGLDSEEEGLV